MEFLKEIKDAVYPKNPSDLKIREATRAILFDSDGMVPLLHVSKFENHKIPGGGVDKVEDKAQALERECLEEIGSKIEVRGEVGSIVEFRSRRIFKQTSYCYFGNIISKGKPTFTEQEQSYGTSLIWCSLEDAVRKLENDKPKNYEGHFIRERDSEFLKKARQILNGSSR